MGRVIFLVGASGVGKTATAKELESRPQWSDRIYYFDEIGVPTADDMNRQFGGGESWQRWATGHWVRELARNDEPLQLLDGQTRPSFINEAADDHPSLVPVIVLLDCSPDLRRQRLERRGQPDLASPQMDSWASYLRGQADALGLTVIDTGETGIAEVADQIEALVKRD